MFGIKRNRIVACFLSALFVLFFAAKGSAAIYLDESKPLEQRVNDALSRMTLEEKVALCHAQSKFSSAGVPRLGIPELWTNDGPCGVRQDVLWDSWGVANQTNDSSMYFPTLTCLAATWNPVLSEAFGKALGEEALYRKKAVQLAPGVNIHRSPFNGRNFEYMGEDPYLASKMSVPYIQGIQSNGVAACVKHFALNNQETWRSEVNVEVSERALREIYLPAFKAAVQEGKVWTVMGAYNQFRGSFCCQSDYLLNQILKKEWGFDGVVLSDWSAVHNTKEAAYNGLDLEMGTPVKYHEYFLADPFLKLLKNGQISKSVVDEKARRILRLIFRTAMNRNRGWGSFNTAEHSKVGHDVAAEGIVLLKNEKKLLPLDRNKIKSIAVMGENATRYHAMGGGSAAIKARYQISPLDGIRKEFGKDVQIKYTMGYASDTPLEKETIPSPYNADSLKREALKMAASSDVVIFVGGLNKNRHQDGEGSDRETYELPYGQPELLKELAKVNKNVVFVLLTGTSVDLTFTGNIPSILQTWYGGAESGSALADVLSGKVNPSGKLPISFPKKITDCGAHFYGEASFPGINQQVKYLEDIFVGYRWYDTRGIETMYPFGFGLSYTSFDYGKIIINKTEYASNEVVNIKFALKNTGSVDGAEVSQVYISQPKSSVPRPAKELKGFAKTYLKAGETKEVEIRLPVKDWAYYDEASSSWKVEPGSFIIQLGASSTDIKQKVAVNVTK
ncbi:MAG: glycoside hydrolase family 3 C-terminal domain-containing protein [Bacteroidales bacterium]|nr:glycoside hydrolase family 3 C-terminal domain-containing protein [Bacteroidales bacterium]